MPRSRPWSASRSLWRSRGSGRPFACASSRAATAGCAVAAPGTVCAVVMAHVAAHTYALAKRGPAAPFFVRLDAVAAKKRASVCWFPLVHWLNESICVTNACTWGFVVSRYRHSRPLGATWILIAACLHALAHFLAASVSNPGRNRATARNSHASRAAREWSRAREDRSDLAGARQSVSTVRIASV